MFTVERQVGQHWTYYSEYKDLSDAFFALEEAFMQDHLEDSFYAYRILDADGKTIHHS